MPDGARRGLFRADEFSPADLAIQLNALDRQAELSGIRRLRDWAVAALGLRPGDRVLDVGAGAGDHTGRLAALAGETVGLEPNPGLREEAARRAPGARFVDGYADDLPFPDESFDAVSCERVFQHLTDPERAAAEIARVLRPGGRAVVTDTDWGTSIIHPGEPELLRVITESIPAGMRNPFAGRLLPGQLSAAGLTVADIGSQALIQPASAATGPLVRMVTRNAPIDDEQRERFLAGLAEGARTGAFHMSVTMFAVLARR
jgi:SAM-dependent methyltransferase